MVAIPLSFQSGELKQIGSGDLDPTTLPASVVFNDGTTPFVAPQAGVDPVSADDLTTKRAVAVLIANHTWMGQVASMTTAAQPGHVAGARYILPDSATGAQWAGHELGEVAVDDGATWTFFSPVAGWAAYVVDLDIFVAFSSALSSWGDISAMLSHSGLQDLQGGTTDEHYHLTEDEHNAINGDKTARFVLAAPTGGDGPLTPRALDGADIQTGEVSTVHGGFGAAVDSESGYPKAIAGSFSFSATIPWDDLDAVPDDFIPASHASTHESGGSDEVALNADQITDGALALERGGLGQDVSNVGSRQVVIGPDGGGGLEVRDLVPDDMTGATVAKQVLQRNAANDANVWALIDTTSLGAVPTSRIVATVDYLAGGGSLSSNLTLSWLGVDVQDTGTSVARRTRLNFINAVVEDNEDDDRIDITYPPGLSSIVAAIVFGG